MLTKYNTCGATIPPNLNEHPHRAKQLPLQVSTKQLHIALQQHQPPVILFVSVNHGRYVNASVCTHSIVLFYKSRILLRRAVSSGGRGAECFKRGGEPQGKWLKIRFRPRISHTLLILHMSFYIPPSPPSRGQILETVLLLRSNLSGLYLKEMVNVNQSTYQFATGMLPSINIGFDLIQS